MSFKNKYLAKKNTPYFISEIGINHNGILSIALKMIKESKFTQNKKQNIYYRKLKLLLNKIVEKKI